MSRLGRPPAITDARRPARDCVPLDAILLVAVVLEHVRVVVRVPALAVAGRLVKTTVLVVVQVAVLVLVGPIAQTTALEDVKTIVLLCVARTALAAVL